MQPTVCIYLVDHIIAWGRDIWAVREIKTDAPRPNTLRTVARCDTETDAQMVASALNARQS
jgi:hypothetical protein